MDGDNNGGEGDLESFPKIGEVCLNRLLLWPVLSTALKFAAILDKSSETPPTDEGNFDGDLDGEEEGVFVGDLDGDMDGKFEGDLDGEEEGDFDGDLDGDVVGDVEGDIDGYLVGNLEGDLVGDLEGDVVGEADGELVWPRKAGVRHDIDKSANSC